MKYWEIIADNLSKGGWSWGLRLNRGLSRANIGLTSGLPDGLALELEPAELGEMKARLVKFGEIEVEGKRYTHDVVIDGGKVRKRKKGPSKQFREKFGHTPLSAGEEIPWGGRRLIVGTGAHGALPVMDEVLAEAKRRGIGVIAAPTVEICELLEEVKKGQAYAVLHCTC